MKYIYTHIHEAEICFVYLYIISGPKDSKWTRMHVEKVEVGCRMQMKGGPKGLWLCLVGIAGLWENKGIFSFIQQWGIYG